MKVLYIFPHPDDESFGPAAAIAAQIRQGHQVYLLTYTRGGATRVRHNLNLSIKEMGEVRYQEMKEVARVLGLTGMTVLDLPDSGLKELDPVELEELTREHIHKVTPDVLVTYPVHGISGFHDHLVTHAVVKRVFCKLKKHWEDSPSRLAFFTLADSDREDGKFNLQTSTEQEIDVAMPVNPEDLEQAARALDCYGTYRQVIQDARVLERTGSIIYFELFQENFQPPLTGIFERLAKGSTPV